MNQGAVLLVEDNADDIELTRVAFRKAGLANELLVVRDGQEALDYLLRTGAYADRAPETDPCVVLLDLKLPRVGGLDVLRQMRADEATRRIPVVVLTSSREEQDLIRSYDLGANAYVRKPVDFAEFQTAVRQLGLFWLLLNEAPPGKEQR